MHAFRRRPILWSLLLWNLACLPPHAGAEPRHHAPPTQGLYVFLIDQLPPQGIGPSFNGLDERRHGPMFNDALQQAVHEGELPPLKVVNKDLSVPDTLASEPAVPRGATLVRVYLTQWAQTPLGGPADSEIFCRFYAELLRDGRVTQKLGPFFARQPLNALTPDRAEDRWSQYRAVARKAIVQLARALPRR